MSSSTGSTTRLRPGLTNIRRRRWQDETAWAVADAGRRAQPSEPDVPDVGLGGLRAVAASRRSRHHDCGLLRRHQGRQQHLSQSRLLCVHADVECDRSRLSGSTRPRDSQIQGSIQLTPAISKTASTRRSATPRSTTATTPGTPRPIRSTDTNAGSEMNTGLNNQWGAVLTQFLTGFTAGFYGTTGQSLNSQLTSKASISTIPGIGIRSIPSATTWSRVARTALPRQVLGDLLLQLQLLRVRLLRQPDEAVRGGRPADLGLRPDYRPRRRQRREHRHHHLRRQRAARTDTRRPSSTTTSPFDQIDPAATDYETPAFSTNNEYPAHLRQRNDGPRLRTP